MNHQQESSISPRPAKPTWNTRGFISLLLLLQTIILLVSGMVRYISPRGREAHWVDWRVLALDKDQWTSIHMVSGLLFIILAVIHLIYNWRLMLSYIRRKTETAAGYGRELAVATVLSLALLGMVIVNLPPVNLLFEHSERLKDTFADSIDRAPWAHAEDADLESVCRRIGISIEQALTTLKEAGIPARNSAQTLAEIARSHGTSPQTIFRVIRKRAMQTDQPTESAPTPQRCGRKTER